MGKRKKPASRALYKRVENEDRTDTGAYAPLVEVMVRDMKGEPTEQHVLAVKAAEQLVQDLKGCTDWKQSREVLFQFVANMDTQSRHKNNPMLLGDSEFAELFLRSLEHRGKKPLEKWAPLFIRCHLAVRGGLLKSIVARLGLGGLKQAVAE